MRNKLKLYVWERCLPEYNGGVVFAFATNAEEAKEQVTNSIGDNNTFITWDGMKINGVDYDVYQQPVGFVCYKGGLCGNS